jgi:diaminopimelate decarboxylase
MHAVIAHPTLGHELVETYGTPLYVYDQSLIQRQYQRLTAAFAWPGLRLHYACKANSNPHLLRALRAMGARLDTVSLQEVRIGFISGFSPQEIIFTPNSVGFEEIREAASLGVHINIDNLSILEQFGEAFGSSYPVCLRINPHIMGGGHVNISTGHIDSKFGISIYQMRHTERIVQHYGIKVEGLHMHTGSDILDTEVFLRAADILFEQAAPFGDLRYLDFGSGFKVAYKEDDYETDLEEVGEKLIARMRQFSADRGKEIELWFEPGKYLVSESGLLLVSCTALKQTTAAVFAGVDSGLNHLIRPMFYGAYHRISNLTRPEAKPRIYTVVGNICETDTFAYDRRLPEIHEGDLLAFHNAGAYGYSMASNYNARPRPAEVLIDLGGTPRLIRRRENLEDVLRCVVEL